MRIHSLALAAVLAASSAAAQSSPTTITPDRSTTLVSKDINGQRWAIARDHATGAVSGNVFVPGSDEPQFVWCRQTADSADGYHYDCSGTGRCAVADCAASWAPLATVVLPHAFFAAGEGPQPTPTPQPPPAGCPRNAPPPDLRVDCSDRAYLFRSTGGAIIAAMTTTGQAGAVCMTDASAVICAGGRVSGAQTVDLIQASVDGGPFFPLSPSSFFGLSGSRLDVFLLVPGDPLTLQFQFLRTEDVAGDLSALFVLPPQNALEGQDADATLRAALERFRVTDLR